MIGMLSVHQLVFKTIGEGYSSNLADDIIVTELSHFLFQSIFSLKFLAS